MMWLGQTSNSGALLEVLFSVPLRHFGIVLDNNGAVKDNLCTNKTTLLISKTKKTPNSRVLLHHKPKQSTDSDGGGGILVNARLPLCPLHDCRGSDLAAVADSV